MKFIYVSEFDKVCRKRYSDFIEQNGDVWGIKRQQSPVKISEMTMTVDMEDIYAKYSKVFGIKPKIVGYIVSTPFSMINDGREFEKNVGRIFFSPFTNCPQKVVAHEMFHIFFEKFTERNIPNYDVSKEYFTVIMNDIIGNNVSGGYPEHTVEREKVWKDWKKSKDMKTVIEKFANRQSK